VQANVSTGLVQTYNVSERDAQVIDIGISNLIVQAQLEQPFSSASQAVFEAAATNTNTSSTVLPNTYNWTIFPDLHVMQRYGWLYIANGNFAGVLDDPFFDSLVKGYPDQAWQLFNSTESLQHH
jgi:hypothetical protein